MEFKKLSKEQALPMYIKLKMVMEQYRLQKSKRDLDKELESDEYGSQRIHPDSFAPSKRDIIKQCRDEVENYSTYVRFFGIPEVCMCAFVNKPDEEYQPCIDLYVEKEHRNQGYGTNMIRYCKTLSDKIYLNVFAENTESIKLYQKEGFRIFKDSDYLIKMVWNKDKEDLVEPFDSVTDFSELTRRLKRINRDL